MRVDVSPLHTTVTPGRPVTITVTVTNTSEIIGGYEIRALGIDPAWSEVEGGALSLFPSQSASASLVISLPADIPSGRRSIEVEVRELTGAGEVATVAVELSVPAEEKLAASLDPPSTTAGKSARVGVLLVNDGTSEVDVPLEGKDDTGKIRFAFDPATPTLGPGERMTVAANLWAHRPWVGSPKIRPFRVEAGPPKAPVVTQGAWVQPPRISRGALALLGLLVAGTVFATVLAVTLSQVVGQSNANRALALQVAEASRAQPATGTATISGVVTLLTTGAPISGVTVGLFRKGQVTSPIESTATSSSGAYHFSGLAAGSYLLSYSGAGFAELWYPDAISAASAVAVTVTSTQVLPGIDIAIGGLPAVISGQVTGPNVTGAVLTVQLPTAQPVVSSSTTAAGSPSSAPAPAATPSTATSAAASPSAATAPAAPSNAAPSSTTGASGAHRRHGWEGRRDRGRANRRHASAQTPVGSGVEAAGTVLTSVTLPASGNFTLTGIPSPATYQLVVVASGDAPAVQEITLGGGQHRGGISIILTPGNGAISGKISSASGPIGGATVTATSGTAANTTVSVTEKGSVGSFSLSNLPSPATVSLTVSAQGFASSTVTVSLAPDQHVTGLLIDLQPGLGSISGTVTTPSGTPVGDVSVSATNGTATVSTVTSSVKPVGSYALVGLAVPATYTVTYSRSDLESQTHDLVLSVESPNLIHVNSTLNAATAELMGTVTGTGGSGIGDVTVSLVSGSTSYEVTTASSPVAGAYTIEGVTPGTYTLSFSRQGGVPVSSIVTLAAGQVLDDSPQLSAPASIFGVVASSTTGTGVPGAEVLLYLSTQFPTTVAEKTTTNASGAFTFDDVEAPESYIVAVAYPSGSSPQVTIVVTTAQGTPTPVCGSASTGTSTASTTSSTGATCDPTQDPVKVSG